MVPASLSMARERSERGYMGTSVTSYCVTLIPLARKLLSISITLFLVPIFSKDPLMPFMNIGTVLTCDLWPGQRVTCLER
jgi:hypothetical protein